MNQLQHNIKSKPRIHTFSTFENIVVHDIEYHDMKKKLIRI